MTDIFTLPQLGLLEEYKTQLVNHNGDDYSDRVIQFEGKYWIIKQRDLETVKREVLSHLLGAGLVNISETRSISLAELQEICKLGVAVDLKLNYFITRLAQSYILDELPLKSLDSAVAGELVFCVWIRRRDPHHYNRVYINGDIPVFFDHDVSFQGEKDIEQFFQKVGPGYAGSWRVKAIASLEELKNVGFRKIWDYVDWHYVYDIENFKSEAKRMVNRIVCDARDLRLLISSAGFGSYELEQKLIFLQDTKATLEQDVEKMLDVVVG